MDNISRTANPAHGIAASGNYLYFAGRDVILHA